MPDALLAACFIVLLLAEVLLNPDMTPHAPLAVGVVAMALPLAWRRASPAVVGIAVCLAHVVVSAIASGPLSPQLAIFPVLVAIYTAASLTRGRVAVVTGVGTSLLTVAGWVITDVGHVDEFWPWMLWAGAWASGTFVRRRGDLAAHHAARAALLEVEARTTAIDSANAERDRIAREMHDVIAHSVSVMVVQAGAERLRLGPAAGRTGEALAAIEDSGRTALGRAPSNARCPSGRLGRAARAGADPRGPTPPARPGTRSRATGGVDLPAGGPAGRRTDSKHRRRRCGVPHRAGSPDQRDAPSGAGGDTAGPARRGRVPVGHHRERRARDRTRRRVVRRPWAPRHAGASRRARRHTRGRSAGWSIRRPRPTAADRGGRDVTDPIRILVAEDQQLVRDGIVTMLGVRDDFVVVAQVGDGERAVVEAHRTHPDVAMLDIRMPVLDGIAATLRIAAELPATKVLVLTTFGSDELVFEALAAGAAGFLLKDVRAEDLLEAVAAVARGEGRLDPAVTAAVVGHFRTHRSAPTPARDVSSLTARETDVLVHLARGLSNAEIAVALGVAPGTVKTHVATVLAKLGVRDRVQAVIAAYESGLVRP